MIRIIKQVASGIARKINKTSNPYRLSMLKKASLRFKKDNGINEESVLNGKIKYNSAPYWFKHSYTEIFEEETYKFALPTNDNLFIIDCGSNIGLSIIYYKLNYPNARIIGIEPDKDIFAILQGNVGQYNFENVQLINKAVWINNENLQFNSKGGMGGNITQDVNAEHLVNVPGIRLLDLITDDVDFLKIDIEGAEMEVLRDCKDALVRVKAIFVEYHCNKGQDQELAELLEIVKAAGFRFYMRQAYENMVYPFLEKTGAYMDMQLNIFCFK